MKNNQEYWIVLASLALIFASSAIYKISTRQVIYSDTWQYQLADSEFIDQGNHVSVSLNPYHLKMDSSLTLHVRIDGGQTKSLSFNQTTLQHEIDVHKSRIKNAIIQSNHPLKPQLASMRLLQSANSSDSFVSNCMLIFQIVFQIGRNMILIGLLTNTLNLLLPFIIFSESFLMLAFWTNSKYDLGIFYFNIFNSKIDVLNFIRLLVSPEPDQFTLAQIAQYKFVTNIFYNISAEFIISCLFLVFTIFVKAGSIFMKSQKLRKLGIKLRPMWNCFFMAILPRLATFAGLHIRMVLTTQDVMNGLICSILLLGFVFFFIQFLLHIRKINTNIQYIEQTRLELGLANRINHLKEFEFDCLRYSILYYPLMNYVRLLIFFIPIGSCWDIYYASYGGVIVSQLLMMMIQISCTGYINNRDKILFPINNFLFIAISLCIITIGLAESVGHSQVSYISQIVVFSILIFIFLNTFISICFDFFEKFKQSCTSESTQVYSQEQNVKTKEFMRNNKIKEQKTVVKGKLINQDKNLQSDEDAQPESVDNNKVFKMPQIKIKKVRKGKII